MAEDIKKDAEESLGHWEQIEAKTKQLLENTVDFNKALKESNDFAIQLETLFDAVIKQSKTLPKNIKSSSDLIKEMQKNAGLLNDIQRQALSIARQQIKDQFEPALKTWDKIVAQQLASVKANKKDLALQGALVAVIKKRKALQHKMAEDLLTVTKETKDQFQILKDSLKVQKQASQELFDTKAAIDDIGSKIRNPAQAAEGFFASLSQGGKKFAKLRSEGVGMGEAMGEAFNVKKVAQWAKMLANPVTAAIVAVTAALVIMWTLFKNYYDFLDKKIMPAQADFNKELGNTGIAAEKLKGQAAGMGVQFELLGLGFADGAKMVRDFAGGMQSVEPFDRETMLAAENLVGVLGMGGEAAGKFALQFKKQDGNLKMLHKTMKEAEHDAIAYGIPVATVQKDLAESPNILARFGTAAAMEFEKSAVKARTFGLSIKEVNSAFGDQMDTFEGTSDAAAKLNTIFGTNINSMELMMETNPEKRMMMLRKELVAQGKEWNNLNVFEKNMIKTTMKVDEQTAALMLGSEKERKALERKAKARKNDAATSAQWSRGIARMQRTLIAWGPIIDKVMRSVTKFMLVFMGFESDDIGKGMSDVQDAMLGLSKTIDKGTGFLKKWPNLVDGIATAFKALILGPAAPLYLILKAIDKIDEFFDSRKAGEVLGKTADIVGKKGEGTLFGSKKKLSRKERKDMGKTTEERLAKAIEQGTFSKKQVMDLSEQLGDNEVAQKEVLRALQASDWKLNYRQSKDVVAALTGLAEKYEAEEEKKKEPLDLVPLVNDALIKKSGEMIQFSPNDDILAATNLRSRLDGGSTNKEDIRAIVQEMMKQEQVIQIELNMDGKVISEAQVKRARTV